MPGWGDLKLFLSIGGGGGGGGGGLVAVAAIFKSLTR
jgi:hypothetical protein